jgi:hypothetical protein
MIRRRFFRLFLAPREQALPGSDSFGRAYSKLALQEQARSDGVKDLHTRTRGTPFSLGFLIRGGNIRMGMSPVDDGKPKMRQFGCLRFDMCSPTSKSLT